jgi:NitT/TauT family transport system substrate-binding protein
VRARTPILGAMHLLRLLLASLLLLAVGCKKSTPADATASFRLGYFPNITHGQGLVGDADGTFAQALAPAKLETKQFNAGPSAMEALVAGSLDATYVGSGPALR